MNQLPKSSSTALKEWAVAVEAMARGDQIIILRKGGIHRDDKEFRIVHPEFLFYPTYEHQRSELIKPTYTRLLEEVAGEFPDPDNGVAEFKYWAYVTDKFELRDEDELERIADNHLWTKEYTSSRFNWRPSQPLTVALLRVYRLEYPASVPVLPEFAGCKSWVDLRSDIELGYLTPAMSDSEYEKEAKYVKGALARSLTLSD